MMLTWGLLSVIALVPVWDAAIYDRLVQFRNRIANAFGQIDVQLKRRHDLVTIPGQSGAGLPGA